MGLAANMVVLNIMNPVSNMTGPTSCNNTDYYIQASGTTLYTKLFTSTHCLNSILIDLAIFNTVATYGFSVAYTNGFAWNTLTS
jgi:hypothetical protein